MKIQFTNNSVSGIKRRYRGFTLVLPGNTSQVIDVPPIHVFDILKYLKDRHPAVICTPGETRPTIEPEPVGEDAATVVIGDEITGDGKPEEEEEEETEEALEGPENTAGGGSGRQGATMKNGRRKTKRGSGGKR